MTLDATFFSSADEWRAWLKKNHATTDALWVGFHKRATGRPSITWKESVDEALCFGWIDGRRQRIDEDAYRIRFSPRRKGSNWSQINLRRVKELEKEGRMTSSGMSAYRARKRSTAPYSYEQRYQVTLDAALENRFRANSKAWAFFEEQPTGYRQLMMFFVMGAKRDETRRRRLDMIIDRSARGIRIPAFGETSAPPLRKERASSSRGSASLK